MNSEIERILNLVKDGKISPEDADLLLRAVNGDTSQAKGRSKGCCLRIRIINAGGEGDDDDEDFETMKREKPLKPLKPAKPLSPDGDSDDDDESGDDDERGEEFVNKHIHFGGNEIVKIDIPVKVITMLAKTTGKLNFNMGGKNEKVRESLSQYGLELGENGEIKDAEAFAQVMEHMCEMAPVELAKISTNEKGASTVVKIWIE